MDNAVFGRQPIYREGVDVFAYELFSRDSELTNPAFSTANTLTAEALLQEFVSIGLDSVAGSRPAFVSVNRDFVLSDFAWLLPRKDVVLQLAADSAIDSAYLKSLTNLASTGYSMALSGFVDSKDTRPIADLADIIKVDVRQLDYDSLKRRVEELKALDVMVLAEHVETHEDYERCMAAGFDYFEGYFFCTPNAFIGQPLPSNRLSTLHLLATLQDPNVTFETLEHAVGQDVAMSYRILRYLNSPIHALPRKVKSLRHAIALVGTGIIRQWASVIWLNSIEEKPRELMVMAMIRAHMCQQLATAAAKPNGEQYFTVGLLSLLDALIDRPMDTVLHDLPLTDDVKAALVHGEGQLGEALQCVRAYERCDWEKATFANLDDEKVSQAYLTSIEWSQSAVNELSN